jgi:hypothetical protein
MADPETSPDATTVDPASIVDQRAKGWPDFHAEDFCHRCGNRNVVPWFTDNPTWNAAEDELHEILCPTCMTRDYERKTNTHPIWELRLSVPPPPSIRNAVLAVLDGNPHACNSYLADRVALLIEEHA